MESGKWLALTYPLETTMNSWLRHLSVVRTDPRNETSGEITHVNSTLYLIKQTAIMLFLIYEISDYLIVQKSL